MFALLGVLTSQSALGQEVGDRHLDNGARKMMTMADTVFELHVAQLGVAEVRLGTLSAQKAESPAVRSLAQQVAQDYSKLGQELTSIAAREKMTLPAEIEADQLALYTKLSKLSGSKFDHLYLRAMKKRCRRETKLFKKEAAKGKDEQVKAFAAGTVPVLEGQLQKIDSIAAAKQ